FPKLTGLSSFPVPQASKSRRPLEQSPLHANPEQGQSVNITCVLKSSGEDEKFILLRTHVQPGRVLSVSNLNGSEVSPAFGNRLEYSREGNRIVIFLHELQEQDSDNYICAQEVKGSPLQDRQTLESLESGLRLLCVLLSSVTNRLCVSTCLKKPNVVYEDMSYNSRRSTLVRTNTYSRGE
uniref:Immunoglobulin V-set domain-containing protein n=1 Tax=Serinus canaria TaxID=9135 RepID=A0A8C9MIZ3_SERCA